ncbi:MAG: hypothetical protein ACP5IC_00965 [Minisyncoccia bacterium]
MTTEEFIKSIENFFQRGVEIVKKKNKDYSGDDDPFKNFRKAEIVGASIEQGIMIRVMDKISRIGNLLATKDAAVKEETIQDTLVDCANYLAILNAYLESKKTEQNGSNQ